ncbi:Gp138 family membrane-puncturing spike protein [Serratia liquefaciens]|uniref:Translation initiation factor IF-2 n=1 Tax=Serratia liquefaciens TaxID=614 RepID=A0A515CT39_SERLI|nr:Gp138 family membrane-puncturing spike protein [Serratia liquefaciens]QDL31321.1 translation initiation factor IF-2 [Serratia liquefaciens]
MPVSLSSQIGDKPQSDQALMDAVSAGMRVSIPGIIQSFDPDTVTCVVQPVVKGYVPTSGGTANSSNLPLLVDVPVVFPSAGGVTITFPVNLGDECEIRFHDRCIDFFWQNGGVQEPVSDRMHSLSDATCYVGKISQPNRIKNISTTSAQFRSDDGSTYLEINPTTKKMKIVAPGGLEVITPLADFSEAVTVKGLLTWMGGMVGSIVSGTAAKITGTVEFIGKVFANGKQIDDKHKHGGVQHGNDDTDEVS